MLRRAPWLLLVTLLAACGSEPKATEAHVTDPEAAVLRVGEPRGYREGDDTACGRIPYAENRSEAFNRFLRKEQPRACFIELDRVWAADVAPSAQLRKPAGALSLHAVLPLDAARLAAIHTHAARPPRLGFAVCA